MTPIAKLNRIGASKGTTLAERTLSQPVLKPELSQPALKPETTHQYAQQKPDVKEKIKELDKMIEDRRARILMRMGELSGTNKYPILQHTLLDQVTPVNPYSKKFTTKRLLKVGDDTSQGFIAGGKLPDGTFTKLVNFMVDYFPAPKGPLPNGVRFIQDYTPTKITSLGPKIFTKADRFTGGRNFQYPDFENLQGYLNMDELHKLALGGDDIANQIYNIYAKEGRGLLARLQYMHPVYQNYFAKLGGNISSHPSSISMVSDTIGPTSNTPETVHYYTPLNPDGPKEVIRKHGEYPLYALTPKAAKESRASYYGKFQSLAGVGTGPIRNERLFYYDARYNNIPLVLSKHKKSLEPITNEGVMDIGSGFHEGIHALNNDSSMHRNKSYLPPHLRVYDRYQNLLREGVIRDARIYATDKHHETTRAWAFAKDPVVNSIRYRVEQLAPELIPDWSTKSTAEQNRIISEIVFDKSEDAMLADRIIRQWENTFGSEHGSVAPYSVFKIKDPTYVQEALRSLADIREMRPTALFSAPAKPINPIIEKLIDALPENYATKLPRPKSNNASLKKYYTLMKKLWPQIAPAITAPVAAPPILDMLSGGNDAGELNYD